MGCGQLDAAAALELATGQGVEGWGFLRHGRRTSYVAFRREGANGHGARCRWKWKQAVSLPFRVGEGSGQLAAAVAVDDDGIPVGQMMRRFVAQPGRVYRVAWHPPGAKTKRHASVLRRALGPVGNNSAQSCAPIRPR